MTIFDRAEQEWHDAPDRETTIEVWRFQDGRGVPSAYVTLMASVGGRCISGIYVPLADAPQ